MNTTIRLLTDALVSGQSRKRGEIIEADSYEACHLCSVGMAERMSPTRRTTPAMPPAIDRRGDMHR
jgi:hypothetical protein